MAKKSNNNQKSAKGGKNGGMQKIDAKAGAYTIGIIVLAFALMAIPTILLPRAGGMMRPYSDFNFRPEQMMSGQEEAHFVDLNNYFALRFVLSVLNIVLVIYLLFIYVKDYLKLKATFTLGIIAFLFSFLLYALSSLPPVHTLLGPFGVGELFSFVPMLFSAIGLLIFAKLGSE